MSVKNLDKRGRLRSKTVSFRVSPEEWDLIQTAVSISGYNKQDYLISKALDKNVMIESCPAIYKALRNKLDDILLELKNINCSQIDNIDIELLETINFITMVLYGLKEE